MIECLPRIVAFQIVLVFTVSSACMDASSWDEVGTRQSRLATDGTDKKAQICCHGAQTISVPQQGIPAHLRHGDELGACPTVCSPSTCDDGDLCTSDSCTPEGLCQSSAVTCEDGNPCTIDSCDPAVGCVSSPANQVPCDDGNDCTAPDSCHGRQCVGTPTAGCCRSDVACDDGDDCTTDLCVDRVCRNDPADCVVADRCLAGFCDPTTGTCGTTPVSCDDSDRCTADACDPARGCVSTPAMEPDACGEACLNCAGHLEGTECVDGRCGCATNADCPGNGAPQCDIATGHCEPCSGDLGEQACLARSMHCESAGPLAGQCAVCRLGNDDCPGASDPVCVNEGVANLCSGCTSDVQCQRFGITALCDQSSGTGVPGDCVGCVVDADCTAPTAPTCINRVCH